MLRWPSISARVGIGVLLVILAFGIDRVAFAQLQITEVMYAPGGNDSLWEWIEIRNNSAGPVDLDGWVVDDDDDATIQDDEENPDDGPNIKAANGNTIVPAGGVAVLYPGDELEFTPSRFTTAWGSGINLIAVDGLTSLTATDVIGLWPSYAAYVADTIPDVTTSPRRSFASTAAMLDYSVDFPGAGNGRSIAWKGTGSVSNGANWVESMAGEDGAPGPFREVASVETTFASAPVNDVADRGNPHAKPGGAASTGLLITEIMFAPASPAVTAGWTSTDFEWVEIFNNTPNPINFADDPHVFDDFVGELDEENITSGILPAGALGILFNADMLTEDDMEVMWGSGNYIPVAPWPALNNAGGDTIAIWDDFDAYLDEEIDEDDHRAQDMAIAAVIYNTVAGQGWPTVSTGNSIYLNDLAGDPNDGENWTRSGTMADTLGSSHASPLILDALVDHPGGDVGSPGTVGVAAVGDLIGDYNDDGRVDAADYTVWRNNFGAAGTTLENRDPQVGGTVGLADYAAWKLHYGDVAAGSGGLAGIDPVPEPRSAALLAIGLLAVAAWHRATE